MQLSHTSVQKKKAFFFFSKLWEMVKDREAWYAAVHKGSDMTGPGITSLSHGDMRCHYKLNQMMYLQQPHTVCTCLLLK